MKLLCASVYNGPGMGMYVSACDVHLPLVVSSARVEHSGLSVQTLWHSTSETHILSERETEEKEKRKGRKD